jgi:endonuclease YncB( thermonuclease family)
VRAYVYLDGDDAETATSLNERLVADGHAYADRRTPHPTHKQFEQAEGEARRRRRGLWKDVRDDQQPAWRQVWLEQFRKAETRPGR